MKFSPLRYCAAWLIHLITASGAVFGVLSAYELFQQQFVVAFWWAVLTVIIDAFDGYFARLIDIRTVIPKTDGALLDNIVDFFNYSLLSALFVLVLPGLLPPGWHIACAVMIVLASCYQFTQADAKTEDHFFKGFPSYWNIAVFYLFFWNMNVWVNLSMIIVLTIATFIPIKYVYPSRMDHLTNNTLLRQGMFVLTLLWGVATIGLLWDYPTLNIPYVVISMGYIIIYLLASLYRTWRPMSD